MTDEQPPMPDEDTSPPADPFEADLVAYLDGELEGTAARKVEMRLASDPDARERANALKKTFELLDYLPKPEPSPTFTTRTLERLPAVRPNPAQSATQKINPNAVSQSANSPTVASSSAVPVAMSSGSLQLAPHAPGRWGLWAASVLVAVAVCTATGYFATGAVHPYLFPPKAPREAPPEELQVADHRAIENLPLYAAADDLDFVNELAKAEFFGEEPAVAFDPVTKPPAVEPEKPSGAAFAKLAAAFRTLPASRQQAVRDLDRRLHALDAPTREQRFRVLEVYATWLDKLPEPDRKRVFAADAPRRRLDEIRKIRNQQWLDGLPPSQRAKLNGLPAAGQAELIRQWKDEEAAYRDEWAFHRTHADDIVSNKVPWPFDSADRRRDVIEFVRVAFRTDDEKRCRFEEVERVRYTAALAQAQEQGGWAAWYGYGRTVQGMVKKYERYLLPEPATGEPVTQYAQLGVKAERWFDKGKGRTATLPLVGKWPDFALTVQSYAGIEKAEKVTLPPLGPARPGDFKEPLRSFVTRELVPALPAADRKSLEAAEGRWPDYPREVIRLARQADLAAPGLMLPVSPKRWESMYGSGPRIKP